MKFGVNHFSAMKSYSNLRLVVLLILAVVFGGGRAAAAPINTGAITNGFLLSASNLTTTASTTNVFFTNNPVVTFITISNASTYVPLSITYVTNEFSGAMSFGTVSNNDFSTNVTVTAEGDNTYVLSLQNVTTDAVAQIIFSWTPLTAGPITNTITVGISVATNTATTNLVINQVFGGDANLSVSNYVFSQAYITNEWVITNDWVTYGIIVTNAGPEPAPAVVLTNQLPPGVELLSATRSYTVSGSNFVFNLGTLSNGTSASFQLTVEPTNAGAFIISDSVTSPETYNVNPAGATAFALLNVTNYLSDSPLAAATNSGQIVNPQNGLLEQMINVQNTGKTAVQAVRVVVAGLTNQLYNASGTNAGQPFVVYPASLAAGATMSLRLQYAPRLHFPFTNGQLQVYEVPATVLNYTPPPAATFYNYATNSPDFYRILPVANNFGGTDMLLEFLNTGGSSFTIVYSSTANFANPMIAVPAVSSSANRIQWLDFGPPNTLPSTGTRYYRVIMNP